MTRFDACLAETLRWEGGWSDHPRDPGGPTMCGIIQRVYDAWRDQMGLARRSVRESTAQERAAIYHQNYWLAVRGDELPAGIDLAVFDFAVNSGPSRAIRALQGVLGVTVDGHLGAMTLATARAADPADVVRRLMAERRRFLRAIPHFATFGRGWLTRCDGVEAAAGRQCRVADDVAPPVVEVPFPAPRRAAAPPPMPPAGPLPLPDPDAQSATQGRAAPPATPPRLGFWSRLKAMALGALGVGAAASEGADVLGALDPQAALSAWDRAAPLIERLTSSTAGHVSLALLAGGILFWLAARAADRHQQQTG